MNINYEQVMARYAQIRYESENKHTQNLCLAYEINPHLKEIDQAIAEKSGKYVSDMISGKIPREEIEYNLSKLRALRLIEAEKTGVDLSPVYSCIKCKDTGFLDAAHKVRCECMERYLNEQRFSQFHLEDESFDALNLELFSDEHLSGISQREQMDYIRHYLQEYVALGRNVKIKTLVFSGASGLGKTYLLKCLLRELTLENTCVFTSAYKMFGDFHADRLGREADIGVYFDADCLFVDDLGSEPVTKNVTVEYFFNLVNERQANGRRTFLATNLTLEGMLKRYDEAVFSRLARKDKSLVFLLKGKDIRLSI